MTPVSDRQFWWTVLVTFVVGGLMAWLGRPLVDPEIAPLGIVSLELASSAAETEAILALWRDTPLGLTLAGFHLGLDYLFLVLYAAAIATGCERAAERWQGRDAQIARTLGWAAMLAAAFDAVENALLLRALFGEASDFRPGGGCARREVILLSCLAKPDLISGPDWRRRSTERSAPASVDPVGRNTCARD